MTAPLALWLLAGLQAASPAAAPAPAPAPASEAAVLLSRRVDLPRLTAGEIVKAVEAAVHEARVPVLPEAKVKAARLPEPDTCAGKKACVLDVGEKLGVPVVVAVQVGSVASSAAPIAVYVEALRVADGASLCELTAEVQRDRLREIAGVAEFAKRLREALGPAPAALAAAAEVEPATETTKVVLALPPPPPVEQGVPPQALGIDQPAAAPSHSAGYAMVGVAAAAAVGAVACLVSGLVMKSEVDGFVEDGVHKVNLTRDGARAKVPVVNALLTTSLVAGIVAAGAGTTAVIVW